MDRAHACPHVHRLFYFCLVCCIPERQQLQHQTLSGMTKMGICDLLVLVLAPVYLPPPSPPRNIYLEEVVQGVDLVHVMDPMHHVSVTVQPCRIGLHVPAGGGAG